MSAMVSTRSGSIAQVTAAPSLRAAPDWSSRSSRPPGAMAAASESLAKVPSASRTGMSTSGQTQLKPVGLSSEVAGTHGSRVRVMATRPVVSPRVPTTSMPST